MGLVSNEEE